jgi:type I restriction enzyme M protein
MVKFLLAKWYDEEATINLAKEKGEDRAYVFSFSRETDPERLVVQVRETFEQAKEWERRILKDKSEADLGIRAAFSEGDSLMFKPHTTVEIVKRLQPWSLRRSSADVKGGVFEDFLSKTFRDDLGQYFTPTPVINLIVGILQPTIDDVIGDPACGSARMLTHALEYVRQREYEKAVAANGGSSEGINPEGPSQAFVNFRDNHLFGAEISRNVMHVARVNTLMNGAPYVDLKVMDMLTTLDSITGGIMEGWPERKGFYRGGLTMILTNPPFGSKVTNERVIKDLAARDGVTKNNGRVVGSIAQEVAFVNRCLEFLAPGGKLGIVLPDGVLANSSMQYVRDWILRWARLKAVVSLPQETFSPYGAGVKTSVVFLEKRANPLSPNGQASLLETYDDSQEDYQVYMARIDNIGYDATGRLSVPEEEAHEPPEVKEAVEHFSEHLGW